MPSILLPNLKAIKQNPNTKKITKLIEKIKRGKKLDKSTLLPRLVVIKWINSLYDSYHRHYNLKRKKIWFPVFIYNFFEEKYKKLKKVTIAKIKLFLQSIYYYSTVQPFLRIQNCARFIELIQPYEIDDFIFYL